MKAVFLDTQLLGPAISYHSLTELDVQWSFYELTRPQETLPRIKEATIIVTSKTLLTKDILASCPHLKLVCIAATGYNNIDVAAAQQLGIKVCNVPNYSTPSVVQLTFAFLFALATNLIPYVQTTREGKWQKCSHFCMLDHPIMEMEGKKLGIIGFGNLGQRVGKIAEAMGMHVLVAQHPSKRAPGTLALDELLKSSDVVTIHAPLTPQTHNLIGRREMELMKPTAFLINTARGGIVNEKDLADCLKERCIAGAGFDVLTTEPAQEDNPLLQKDIPNLLLTPHIGWGSFESRTRLIEIIKENIMSFLKNTPKNLL